MDSEIAFKPDEAMEGRDPGRFALSESRTNALFKGHPMPDHGRRNDDSELG